MLTHDLVLKDAIGDLVDNSVDGAHRVKGDDNYDGLCIKIEIKEDYFCIIDNCGGISIDLARDYVFRFGRPEEMPSTDHSIGQFGIGMKRALFQLGSCFEIESKSNKSYFVVKVNVDDWKINDKWEFEFDKMERYKDEVPELERYTKITVTSLYPNISDKFRLGNFIGVLMKEISIEQLENIKKGLKITVNEVALEALKLQLIQSDDIRPAYWDKIYEDSIRVRIYAGISKHELENGGWYIFCNNRLVLGSEQSIVTGWGDKGSIHIPKYHGQYDRFRGYVFFDAENASLLPLNTTKTNMDTDSPKFIRVREKMIELMRPVINFCDDLHDEGKETENQPLRTLVESLDVSNCIDLADIDKSNENFNAPDHISIIKIPQKTGSIQYSKPLDEIKLVQKALNVQSRKEVGEKTFEYYMEMEVK